ncbi:MAG: RnfABCDGE type electron transport complex subunit D, partial [Candidatus Kerfeldbacteria bacterium]|nr:RnfABCDGE type electron transport complex subunit D [Candidatus Kerfeldbacteria bacterium]
MFNTLDNLLNRVTMYRLVIYVLIGLVAWGVVLGFVGRVSFSGWSLIGSTLGFVAGTWLVNTLLAWGFSAPAHNPSAYITGLILALIVTPVRRPEDVVGYAWIIAIAMSSKYILAIHRQHLFNPAAFSVALTAVTVGTSASWWVGNVWMLPLTLVVGFLIVRKLRRWDAVLSFLGAAMLTTTILTLWQQAPVLATWKVLLTNAPLFFFASVMLTEPATMPPTRRWRVVYGVLIGLLGTPLWHIGSWYMTPEVSLLVGNVTLYFLTRRER